MSGEDLTCSHGATHAPDFDAWEFFENVEVNAKKKKRSRLRLCGEQWWDIGPSFILLHMAFDPAREVQKKYGKCAKINDPANPVWREKCAVFLANTMRVKDAKKAAKLPLAGGIDHAAVGRGRDIPTERRGRGVCSFGGTYPARQ